MNNPCVDCGMRTTSNYKWVCCTWKCTLCNIHEPGTCLKAYPDGFYHVACMDKKQELIVVGMGANSTYPIDTDKKQIMTRGLGGCTAVLIVRGQNATLHHVIPGLINTVTICSGDIVYIKTPLVYELDDEKYNETIELRVKNAISRWRSLTADVIIKTYSTKVAPDEPDIYREMRVNVMGDGNFEVLW